MDKFNTIQIILSASTLVVAIVSAVVAVFTLNSQRETQKNTKTLVDSREALTSYLYFCFFSLIKVECFLFDFGRIMRETKCKAKLNASFFAGAKFDLSPFNSNLFFYSDNVLYSDTSMLKIAFSQINDLIDALSADQGLSEISSNNVIDYLFAFKANLENAYKAWYMLSFKHIPHTIKSGGKRLKDIKDEEIRDRIKTQIESDICVWLQEYINECPKIQIKEDQDIINQNYIILQYFNDENLKKKAKKYLDTIFSLNSRSKNYIEKS